MSTFSLALALALTAAAPASAEAVSVAEEAQAAVPPGPEAPVNAASDPASALEETAPASQDEAAIASDVLAADEAPASQVASAEPGDDIVVTARGETPGDPLADLNAKSYEVIQAVDGAVIGPIAMGYKSGMPKPLRLGLRNFLRNLEEPVIAFNYLLQLKPGRAIRSVGRFAVNSTVGVAGLVDVAKNKPFNLPYTPNGFANTFACYGIGSGPYFFLPLVGPTTLRDVIGLGMDRAALPAVVGKPLDRPYYAIPANVIDSLNDRIDIDDQLERIRTESADPYAATRDLYLAQRKSEIAAICPKKGEAVDPTLPPRPGKGRD